MMTASPRKKSVWFLTVGLILGLSVGVGMMAGTIFVMSRQSPTLVLPEKPVFATGSHGASKFAMATGRVDQESEGVFMLDFLTGDLTCIVMYPRTGKFQAHFVANVVRDLGATAARGKEPAYVMVTGETQFRQALNVAQCIVYVADANTGQYLAYGLPWVRNAVNNGANQQGQMRLLFKGTARNVRIRNN